MGKAMGALAALLILTGAALVPARSLPARAQSAPTISCSSGPEPSPMQGHYTGKWHSDGLYHFNALGHDIQLTVTIDGTLDVTMTPDGRMTGTAQGNVQAPVTHEGQKDVSSGYGTIAGQIQGVYSASGSVVLLSHPSILMHWGTFVGGGYTADRTIIMPDYRFPVGAFDCTSAQGTIAETDFPEQEIVDDANGTIAQIPGVGAATGTWSMTSDSAAKFASLSQQVDDFIAHANALLGDPSTALSPSVAQQQIASSLKSLEAAIAADPTVARCLFDRLGAWEALAVHALQARAQSAGITDLLSLRHTADTLRAAQGVNMDCGIALDVTAAPITTAGNTMLDAAMKSRSWSQAALLARELVLLGGDGARASLQTRLNADFHGLLGSGNQLALARAAYLFGDDTDAATAAQHAPAHSTFVSYRRVAPRSSARAPSSVSTRRAAPRSSVPPPSLSSLSDAKKKKSKKKKHKTTPKPTPKPTPTPKPKTLTEILTTGVTPISAAITGETTLTWKPVSGAATYVVAASSGGMISWSWSGSATQVTYGDTAIDGAVGTAADGWPIASPGTLTWSVLALDAHGAIIGAVYRVG